MGEPERLLYFIKPLLILLTLLLPQYYPPDSCELIAKEFQRDYGGQLVLFFPLTRSGAFDFDRLGHLLNYKEIDGVEYYLDWREQRIMTEIEYRGWIRLRFYGDEISEAQYFVERSTWFLSKERPPFSIYWQG